jgi:lipopolysaccharide export system protein LptA
MTRPALLLLLAVACATASAAEPARQLPVKLRADRIEIDQKTGVSRYLGKVVLTQGTVRLTADRAEARALDQSLQRVTAHGQPLTFRERLEDGSGFVEGEARHAEYEAIERRIHLRDRVELRRGRDVLRAGRMRYDIDLKTVHAESDGDQRVVAALAPRRRTENGSTP